MQSRLAKFGLYAFLALFLFLNTFARDREYVYSIVSVGVLAVLIAGLTSCVLAQREPMLPGMRALPIAVHLLILLLMMVSTLINALTLPQEALIGVLSNVCFHVMFLVFLLVLLMCVRRVPRVWLPQLSKFLLFFAVVASVVAYQRILTGGALVGPFRLEGNRWPQLYGWFESPNFFVNVVAFGLLGAIYLASKRWRVGFSITMSFFLFAALVLSGSKGGIVAVLLALAAFAPVFYAARASSRTLLLFMRVVGIGVVFLIVGYFALAQYLEASGYDFAYLMRTVVRLQSIETGTGRLSIWADALGLFLQSSPIELLFGRGNGYFQAVVGHSPHNGHIRTLVEYGIFAAGLVLVNAFLVVLRTFRLVRQGYTAEALLLFALFFYVFFRTIFNSSILSAGLLGFVPVLVLFVLSFGERRYFIRVPVHSNCIRGYSPC